MPASLQVDMTRLVYELRMVDKRFAASIRREIRSACEVIGESALVKIRNATAWSRGTKHGTSIADATTLRPNFSLKSAGVRVSISRAKAPHASVFDLGNHDDGSEDAGTFTNGKKGAVNKRPFFFKTLKDLDPEVETELLKAIDIITREAGFR